MKKSNRTINFRLQISTIVFLFLAISCSSSSANMEGEKNADGSFKKWHRIELVFDGPFVNESSATFRNYRLDVTFTSPSGKEYNVPGFFDADGDPANTSATSGNKWKVRFAGGEEGDWIYKTSFVTGNNVAADLSGGTGGIAPDGETGTFTIGPQDKSGKDFRARGKLEYVGEPYLRFANGDYFIKLGANSPEVFLEYGEFDGTPGHDTDLYIPHISEWNTGDPTWGDGKGKGIIGVVNYLSSLGLNVHYFLCMNAYGDGQEAWPWIAADSIDIYDVSKLAQWEILFTHFDKMGLMVHFQLSESENTNYLEDRDGKGTFSNARKVLYRELIARFGHHMAITWNIGEENQAKGTGFEIPNTHSQRKEFASRIRELTYYNDHISVHNGPAARFDDIFPQLIGYEDITGPSLQTYLINPKFLSNHEEVGKWYDISANSGHKWVVSIDEPWWGKRPEDLVGRLRKEVVWGAILAGGHMEFYAGGDDVKHIDYRKYEDCWKAMGNAAVFMNTYLAKEIADLKPNDDLAVGEDNWAMADEGQTYLLYLKNGGEARVDLSGASDQEFSVHWYDPRIGGDLIAGTPGTVSGGSENVSMGIPPNAKDQDWVLLLRALKGVENIKLPVSSDLVLDLDADAGLTLEDDSMVTSWTNQAPDPLAVDFKITEEGRTKTIISQDEPGTGRPTLLKSSSEINGHNSLIFRENELINDNDEAFHGMMTGAGYTWFAVIKPYEQGGPGKINSRYPNAFFGCLRNSGPPQNETGEYAGFWGSFYPDGRVYMGSRNGLNEKVRDSVNTPEVAGPPPAVDQWHIIMGRQGSGKGIVQLELFINDPSEAVNSSDFPVGVVEPSRMAIGTERNAINHQGKESFDGELARLLMYETALDLKEMKEVYEYLRMVYFE